MSDNACDLLCLDVRQAERVRAGLPSSATALAVAALAKSLADPTRVRVATALMGAPELCVCDLAWITGLAQNLVSHHVRQLRSAGLAASRRDGRMIMYALTETGRALLDAVSPTASPTTDIIEDLVAVSARGNRG